MFVSTKNPHERVFGIKSAGSGTAQNTPNSISNKITVMGTPSNQAMSGIVFSLKSVRVREPLQCKTRQVPFLPVRIHGAGKESLTQRVVLSRIPPGIGKPD